MPSISNVSVLVACDTTALVLFTTSTASHAYVDYGTTGSYGSATIDDTVRTFKEHAAVLTGLSASQTYHFRITAADANGSTQTSDDTFATAANGTNIPALPQTLIDTRMPDLSGATFKTVKNSAGDYTPANFQNALNDARDGSGKWVITVDAGITLTGQYTIGNKVDSNWIIVRSSAHASLPEGKRVSPLDTGSMFKITNTNTDPPLITATTAHHWRFVGAEITVETSAMADAPGGSNQSVLFRVGSLSETSESQWPHHLVLDRCYVHGQPNKNTIRGVYNNGTDNAYIDCYFSEFHGTGNDSQAILHGQGRRLKIVNNYLEAAGENFMSGGIVHTVSPVTTPSDFEFTHNFIAWKQSWKSNDPSWDGIDWVTKNQFEIKQGKRALVFANVFDKWWSSEQTGGSIALKSSNDDKNPAVVTSDVVWLKNHHKNQGSAIAINGSTWPDEESTDYTRRIWFYHNLFEINGDTWDNEDSGDSSPADCVFCLHSVVDEGGGVFRKQYPDDLRIVHCTFTNANATQSSRRMQMFGEVPTSDGKAENFWFKDNVCGYGSNGIKCDGNVEGNASLNAITNSATRTWDYNLIAGSSSSYPADNNEYVSSFTDIKFVSMGTGLGGNYRLASDSLGKNTASDGTDRGCNIDALERAVENTLDGDWTVSTSQSNSRTKLIAICV